MSRPSNSNNAAAGETVVWALPFWQAKPRDGRRFVRRAFRRNASATTPLFWTGTRPRRAMNSPCNTSPADSWRKGSARISSAAWTLPSGSCSVYAATTLLRQPAMSKSEIVSGYRIDWLTEHLVSLTNEWYQHNLLKPCPTGLRAAAHAVCSRSYHPRSRMRDPPVRF